LSNIFNVIGHLEEILPPEWKELNNLLIKITDVIYDLQEMVEAGDLQNMRFEKEEEKILGKFKDDLEHCDWKAVKDDIAAGSEVEEKALKLKEHELKELHEKFGEIVALMKKSETVLKGLERKSGDITKKEEYYFSKIYKFFKSYERIFRHLWRKERRLAGKLK